MERNGVRELGDNKSTNKPKSFRCGLKQRSYSSWLSVRSLGRGRFKVTPTVANFVDYRGVVGVCKPTLSCNNYCQSIVPVGVSFRYEVFGLRWRLLKPLSAEDVQGYQKTPDVTVSKFVQSSCLSCNEATKNSDSFP